MNNRRFLSIVVLSLAMSVSAMAQSYSSLWKQFDKACDKDLPKSELSILNQIRDKAQGDGAYGQLLKSELQIISVQASVSPDSLAPQLKRYERLAASADNQALSAVYCSTLGHIYRDWWHSLDMRQDSAKVIAARYFKQSLRNPQMLASIKAGSYEPLVVEGNNSSVFNDDLLHVLAMEAEDYDLMCDYYQKAGNRPAACISAYYNTQKDRKDDVRLVKKSKYLATIDSLINVYKDLPEAGELAIEHFNFLDNATDASAKEKVEYIDYALINWPTWPRMAVLKNARNRITLPSFSASVSKSLATPGQEIPVYVTSLTHIDKLKMDVYKVNVTGADEFDPRNEDDYKMLRTRMSDKPVWSDDRVYYGLPEYLVVRDTMRIAPLPVGVYMVEFTTDNSDIAVERTMINISNLRLVSMNLPGNKMRMAVLDATTGKPIAGAKINIKFGAWKNHDWVEDQRTLTTEEDGEVMFSSTLSPQKYLVTTDFDKSFPWQTIGHYTWRNNSGATSSSDVKKRAKLFSDRAIYRPGQNVKASVLVYDVYSPEQWQAAENCNVRLVLRNAKNEKVADKEVVTDEWGVATADFDLPADGTTGYNTIVANIDGHRYATSYFRVEEYKRPAFSVSIDDYKDTYKENDTIRVKGWAKTYSGVAVQNAKVTYTVKSQYRTWCWRTNVDASEYYEGEAVTGNDGSFYALVPVQMPDASARGNRFATVIMDVTVTDKAGESHAASASYPLSDKPQAFALQNFSDKQCRERSKVFSFLYMNNAEQKIDSVVTYCVDASAPVKVKTNTETTLSLDGLSSGRHILKAYCGSDTLTQNFIVFSLRDTAMPVDTVAWYYATTADNAYGAFKDGEQEYIQIGTSEKDQTVLYAVVSDTTLLESGQMILNGEVKTRTMEYKEEWGDGIAIRYAWARNGELYTYEQRYARPTKENRLVMEWKTFRDRLVPGQKEEWTMTVKNADGTPAKAQVMAVMYDKSLDAIKRHSWQFNHVVSYGAPTIMQQAIYNNHARNIYGEQTFKPLTESDLQFSRLDIPELIYGVNEIAYANVNMGRRPMLMSAKNKSFATVELAQVSSDNVMSKGAVTEDASASPNAGDDDREMDNVPMRENLNETAFFMPQLVTDKSGNVSVKFTLPESLTTWRFLSLSHDKQMNIGSMESEVIAQKKLMIQPNMPRFIREGDKAQMSAIITNNHDRDISGKAYVQLLRSSDEKAIAKTETHFSVKAGEQTSVTFSLPANLTSDEYICRVVAQTSNYSDGEQHLLPVLSDKVEVTTTKAFTQTKAGEKTIDLKPLYGDNARKESLKVEYTNNPAWLMLEALPVVGNPDAENAISLAVALYANSITDAIKSQMPADTTIAKTTVSATRLIGQLGNLQNVNGSFSWYNGMHPSLYVTQSVAKILARMKHLGIAETSVRPMLKKAMAYLDVQMAEYVAKLKRMEKDNKTKPSLSDTAFDYLYIQSICGDNLDATANANASYLLSLMDNSTSQLSIYGKANLAIVSALHPVKKNKTLAKQLLESVRQYTVQTEEMGRYFDTPKATYSWCDYKIPTQTSAIEALQTIVPNDKQTIADMQQWLLQEKRTQQWNTPLNSASAIYAFFNGWNFSDKNNSVAEATADVESTRLYVDNKLLAGGNEVSGKGYVSQTLDGRHSSFRAVKTSDNISWGAVYATCTQPISDVASTGESLAVKREILDEKGNKLAGVPQVGQKVTVRLTVVAKRDLDFVEIIDNRAACLEPVVQTSGYSRGYYEAPGDNKTTYSFDKLAKGKHVMETLYYIDRAGNYTSGIVTAKCAYAPEFQARDKSLNIETK